MAKMHTRIKRKIGLNSHFRHRSRPDSEAKSKRPKTFKTEEGARSLAEKNKLSPAQYTIEKAKKNKRFMAVVKQGNDKKS